MNSINNSTDSVAVHNTIHHSIITSQSTFVCLVFALCATEVPAGYPNKNNRNEKIAITQGTIERRKRLSLFPFTIVTPALSFFPLPSLPMTQRGLYGGERVVFVKTLLSDKVHNSVTMVNISDRFSSTVGNRMAPNWEGRGTPYFALTS